MTTSPSGRVVMSPNANPRVVYAILNTCQMPSCFYIIPFNVNKSQTHLLKSFIARNLMQAKHADVCSVVLFWTACTSRTHVLSLPSRCEKSDSWRQAGSVKTAKESWTLSQCGHVTLNCVQMASKQANVEFSSQIFQFTRLQSRPKISWSRDWWLKKSVNKCNFFPYIFKL